MNKTINEVLQIVDAIKPNTYDISAKLQWINEVDGSIWAELFQYKRSSVIDTLEGISTYPLPEGTNFNRITNAYLNGVEIPKLSNAQYKTTGISRGDNGNLILYPVPTESGELVISYVESYIPHSISDMATTEVLAESPYDKMYIHYLSAMVDFTRREFSSYNNTLQLFNQSYIEYAEWLAKNGAIERRDWGCISLLQGLQNKSTKDRT
jgi:hypothetical protein